MSVPSTPAGYHSVTPYLIVRDAAAAIDFYQRAFGAVELMRLPGPGNSVAHAEVKIGDSPLMLADEAPAEGQRSPATLGGTATSFMIYVPDVDAQFARALAAGGVEQRPCATSSTATAAARWSIRSGIRGRSPRTSRTSRPRKSIAGCRS